MKYVVVSKEEGLYHTVRRRISEQSPGAFVTRAGSVREGVSILEKAGGQGILLTDFGDPEFLKLMRWEDGPEVRAAGRTILLQRGPEETAREDETEGLSYMSPDDVRGNTKADLGFVKCYIRMHLDGDLSLQSLSRVACLTPNYLSALFRRKEGEPLKNYIERNRVERAAYLLLTEDSQMTEIAAKVGYRHCSYFCRVFKAHYGLSPLQYRRKNREQTGERRRNSR